MDAKRARIDEEGEQSEIQTEEQTEVQTEQTEEQSVPQTDQSDQSDSIEQVEQPQVEKPATSATSTNTARAKFQSFSELSKKDATLAKDPRSSVHSDLVQGDARGIRVYALVIRATRKAPQGAGAWGSESLQFMVLNDTELSTFEKYVPKNPKGTPSKEIQVVFDINDKYTIGRFDDEMIQSPYQPGPAGGKIFKSDKDQFPPLSVVCLDATKYTVVTYPKDGAMVPRLKIQFGVVKLMPISPVEFLLSQKPQNLRIDQPLISNKEEQIRRLFGYNRELKPGQEELPWPLTKEGNPLVYRTENGKLVFAIVPAYRLDEMQQKKKNGFVAGMFEGGLDADKMGLVTRTVEEKDVSIRTFNAIRGPGYVTKNHYPIRVIVVHSLPDLQSEKPVAVVVKGRLYPESVGQLALQTDMDHKLFAYTFYKHMVGLGMVFSGDKEEHEEEEEEMEEEEESDVFDIRATIKAKTIKLNIDLAATVRNCGVRHPDPITEFKSITGKVWRRKNPVYVGHYAGRTFETYANPDPSKGNHTAIKRPNAFAINLRSIKGDLKPVLAAMEKGEIELFVVTPHRDFTDEELRDIQDRKDMEAFMNKARYPHVENVPVVHYLVSNNKPINDYIGEYDENCVENDD